MFTKEGEQRVIEATRNYFVPLGLPRTYTVRNFYTVCLDLVTLTGHRSQLSKLIGAAALQGHSSYYGYNKPDLHDAFLRGALLTDVDVILDDTRRVNPPVFNYHLLTMADLTRDETFTAVADQARLNPFRGGAGVHAHCDAPQEINKLMHFIINKPGSGTSNADIDDQFIQVMPSGGASWICCDKIDPQAHTQLTMDHVLLLMARYIKNIMLFSATPFNVAAPSMGFFPEINPVFEESLDEAPVDSIGIRFAARYPTSTLNPLTTTWGPTGIGDVAIL